MIRTTRTWRVAAAAMAAGLTLAACGTTDDSENNDDNAGSGGDASCDAAIAYIGPLTGDYANLGINIVNGVNLALEEFKEAEPDCKIELKKFDSQGDPEKATPLADQIIGDDKILGVVGPTFSGESDATGQNFADNGLVTVSPSATNPQLTQNGWETFFRILGNDIPQGEAAAKYITDTIGATKVFAIDDASEYGVGITDAVKEGVGDAMVGEDTVQLKQTDFSATVTKVKASGADAVWFGGYYPEAGLLAKQLKAGGWNGTFVSGDGSNDPGFVEAAGAKAAEGAVLTCPCAPAEGDFAKKYEESAGQEAGTYSGEGYDAANILLQGIVDGNDSRDTLLEWVKSYDDEGVTKPIKFDENGDVEGVTIYAYTVKGGKIADGTAIE